MLKKIFASSWTTAVRPQVVQYLGIWITLSILVAVLGPFGTFLVLGFGLRFFYWAVVIGIAFALALAIRALINRLNKDRIGPLTADLALISVFALAYSPILFAFSTFFAEAFGEVKVFPLPMTDVIALVTSVGLVIVLAHAIWRFWHRSLPNGDRFSEFADRADDRDQNLIPDLCDRLPEDIRGPVLVVSVRDHYVDVFTPKGRAALLMRFSDALRELTPYSGMQIHRSHWVADAHVCKLRREGARRLVHLACGTILPISRSFQQAAISRWGDAPNTPGESGLPGTAVSTPESR